MNNEQWKIEMGDSRLGKSLSVERNNGSAPMKNYTIFINRVYSRNFAALGCSSLPSRSSFADLPFYRFAELQICPFADLPICLFAIKPSQIPRMFKIRQLKTDVAIQCYRVTSGKLLNCHPGIRRVFR